MFKNRTHSSKNYFFQFLATMMALESVFWTIVTNGMTPQDIMEDNFGMFTASLNFLSQQKFN